MDQDEALRKQLKPRLDVDKVPQLVKQLFDLSVDVSTVKELDSYDDCNFEIRLMPGSSTEHTDGAKFVLKIHNGVETINNAIIEAQVAVIGSLSNAGFACPRGVALSTTTTTDPATTTASEEIGHVYLPMTDADKPDAQTTKKARTDGDENEEVVKQRHAVRLLHYVPGTLLADVPMTDDFERTDVLRDAGIFMAGVSSALIPFEHPALKRELIWDVQQFPTVGQFVDCISDSKDRALVESVFALFDKTVLPVASELRTCVLQGDMNDRNIIVNAATDDKPRSFGIIDFGDTVQSWLVNELAIAMAYIIIGGVAKKSPDPVQYGADLFAGYNAKLPLTAQETGLLRALVAARLATSVTLGAYSLSKDPKNEYLLVHAKPGWDALRLILEQETSESFMKRLNAVQK